MRLSDALPGAPAVLLVANASGLAAALALSLLLIPSLGAEGGAVATVGAEATLALVTIGL